jgi:hypothetical protein
VAERVKDEARSLRTRLSNSERGRAEDRDHYFEAERERHNIVMARNDLAWLALNVIQALKRYDGDPTLGFIRDGMRHRLEELMPGFQAQIQSDQDARDEGNAKADAAERERRKAKATT